MSRSFRAGVLFPVLIVAVIAACRQIDAGPTNDLPNPYRAVENWA
jgi:hypothetical protein